MGTGERSGDALDVDVTERVEAAHDGDDIAVVVSDPEHPTHTHGARVAVIAGIAAVVLATIGAWVISQGVKDPKVITQHAAATPAAQQPAVAGAVGAQPTNAPTASTTQGSTPVSNPTSKVTSAPARNNGGSNNAVAPPAQPPAQQPSGPKTSPVSALVWTGKHSVDVPLNGTTTITITVSNPTDGTVTLPHQLSCPSTWILTDAPVCAEVTQQIAPHASLTTKLTIDATGATAGTYSLYEKPGGVFAVTAVVS